MRRWGLAPVLVRRNPATGEWAWRCRRCRSFAWVYESRDEATHGAHLHLKWRHNVTLTCTRTRTVAYPRTFTGYRPNPPAEYVDKAITNAGRSADYEGVVFSDGTVVLRWLTEFRSHSVWSDWASMYRVHGHPEYGTVIEFHDGGDAPDER